MCRAVMLPRRVSRRNLQGCPKLANRSQPLVGRSSPIMKTCGGGISVYQVFFPIVDTCLSSKDVAQQSCAMVPKRLSLRDCCQSKLLLLKPYFFPNWPLAGQNRFLPVVERLLITDYHGISAYAEKRKERSLYAYTH